MIHSRALPDLLAAERALARADVLLRDGARRHACDAARRGAIALFALDGALVSPEDVSLALAAPDEVDWPRRADAAAAAGMVCLLADLRVGMRRAAPVSLEPDADARLRPATLAAWAGLAADARRLLAEAEAALAGDPHAEEGGLQAWPGDGPWLPWTVGWVEEIHARWHEIRHGHRPAAWDDAQRDDAREILRVIDTAIDLSPGLAGASRALHRLHHAVGLSSAPSPLRGVDEDGRSHAIRSFIARRPDSGWWPAFARIVAPHMVARACGLGHVWMPVPVWWAGDRVAYRLGIGGSEEEWIGAMARLTADAVEREVERARRIEARHAEWLQATALVPRPPRRRPDTLGPTRRLRAGRRRSNGRLPRLLELLWEQPVVSARMVERRLGMGYRSALALIDDLEKAGVLRRANDRALDRLWRAVGV